MHIESSIIVPVFNRAVALRECVHSIAVMKYQQWELIIVNDGSTDSTPQEIEKLKQEFSNYEIRSVDHEKCLGISASRNSGIREARGDYVFFTDSDCIVAPDWISKQLDIYETSDAQCLSGLVDDIALENYFAQCFTGCHFIYQNKFQKRLLIENNMSFKRSVFKDSLFEPRITYGGDGNYIAWKLLGKGIRFGYAPDSKVTHLHPIGFKEFSRIAFLQGQGEAIFWIIKKSYIGRDIVFLFLSLLFFFLSSFCNFLSKEFFFLGFLFFLIQLVALTLNEICFKRKTLLLAIGHLPGQLYFCFLKFLGSLRTYVRLVYRD